MLTEQTYQALMGKVQEERRALSALVRETSVPSPDWDRVRAAREQVMGQAACVAGCGGRHTLQRTRNRLGGRMGVFDVALCVMLLCAGAIALGAVMGLCVATIFVVATWALERFGGK